MLKKCLIVKLQYVLMYIFQGIWEFPTVCFRSMPTLIIVIIVLDGNECNFYES